MAPEPVPARPASTVVLLRDGGSSTPGLEAYLIRRTSASSFAADAYVFPGGTLDEADADPALLATAPGFDLAQAARRMGLDDDDGRGRCGAHHVAAVRELFEESGVLLSVDGRGLPPSPADGPRLAAARRQLLEGGSFAGLLEGLGLRLALSELVYAARFVTPLDWPKRFDVRFFLARAPEGQEAAIHEGEASAGGWHQVPEVLAGHERGEVKLMPPTVVMLQRLAELDDVAQAMTELGERPLG